MDKLDPVLVMTAVAGLLMGQELAQWIGPYAVIILGATTGAGWSLGRQEPMTRLVGLWFFTKVNLTALLITVPVAVMTATVLRLEQANWMLVPISMMVGGIGNDWPKVGRWILERLGRLIERRAGVGQSDGNGD